MIALILQLSIMVNMVNGLHLQPTKQAIILNMLKLDMMMLMIMMPKVLVE